MGDKNKEERARLCAIQEARLTKCFTEKGPFGLLSLSLLLSHFASVKADADPVVGSLMRLMAKPSAEEKEVEKNFWIDQVSRFKLTVSFESHYGTSEARIM